MSKTIFDHKPVLKLFQLIASFLLFCFRWRTIGKKPDLPKYVTIAAPHTSNWDFFFTITIALKLDIQIHWLGKASLFEGLFGKFLLYLGGVPVDRSKSNNLVDQMAELIKSRDNFTLVVPPEGTRKHVTKWKTGFYYIALKAEVPILLGFLDFKRRTGGFLDEMYYPSGDAEKDIAEIQAVYKNIIGKNAENFYNAPLSASISEAASNPAKKPS